MLKLKNNYIIHFLDPDLALDENLALIDEQIRIERLSLLSEIKELRAELDKCAHEHGVKQWDARVDCIYERLYFYGAGICSRVKGKHPCFLPYTYRRTVRNFFS